MGIFRSGAFLVRKQLMPRDKQGPLCPEAVKSGRGGRGRWARWRSLQGPGFTLSVILHLGDADKH